VTDGGRNVFFQYYANGVDAGTGTFGANSTATFSTRLGRQVVVRLQGNTVSGTYANQAFNAERESDLGPVAGISGEYTGAVIVPTGALAGAYGNGLCVLRLYPSGKAHLSNYSSAGEHHGVGTLAANGSITFSISSSYAPTNGDSLSIPFRPNGDSVGGNFSSRLLPLDRYVFSFFRVKGATVVNVATRGAVTPIQAMTAGFVITGGSKTVLIRAVGPTLAAFGVVGANADPELTLYSGQTILATNDNWGTNANAADIVAASVQVGAFALVAGSRDAVIMVRLQPGAYTASASSRGSASGDALIEVYEVTK
jgi:hypothetical protein